VRKPSGAVSLLGN